MVCGVECVFRKAFLWMDRFRDRWKEMRRTMFAVKTAAAVAVVILVAIGAGATVCRAQAEQKPLTYLIDDVSRLPSEAARMYAYVTRTFWPRELAYREIPWLVDLNDGMRVAREENRPLLLWTSGDEPLDRC
jgi:hypothetical protein